MRVVRNEYENSQPQQPWTDNNQQQQINDACEILMS